MHAACHARDDRLTGMTTLVLTLVVSTAAAQVSTAPPFWTNNYTWMPRIHWAQGCLESCIDRVGGAPHVCRAGTHDISGGIIQADGTFHTWIGCFMSQPGGGWQHVASKDLVHWKLQEPFQGQSNRDNEPRLLPCIQAGAVGIDDDGTAFAVESNSAQKVPPGGNHSTFHFPYNAYRFTNASNNAWGPPEALFHYTTNRGLAGDPPRPWKDPRDNRWYASLSFNGCNESMVAHPSEVAVCSKGGEAKMWSSPALFGPKAEWTQTPSLLVTNETVLNGKNGLANRPSVRLCLNFDSLSIVSLRLICD